MCVCLCMAERIGAPTLYNVVFQCLQFQIRIYQHTKWTYVRRRRYIHYTYIHNTWCSFLIFQSTYTYHVYLFIHIHINYMYVHNTIRVAPVTFTKYFKRLENIYCAKAHRAMSSRLDHMWVYIYSYVVVWCT